MDLATLRDRLLAIAPETTVPGHEPGDDLYAFAFAGRAFGPQFDAAIDEVATGARDPAHRLMPLADLLEQVFAEGDDDIVDGAAMRIVHGRLVSRPERLATAWPYLGARTRGVAGKFQALEAACDRREAAVHAGRPAHQDAGTSVHAARSTGDDRGAGSGMTPTFDREEHRR